MPDALPSISDIAAAALAIGLLFLARFALALRRLRVEGRPYGGSVGDLWGSRRVDFFGAEREPERRHAVRQFGLGIVFLAVALALYGWLVSSSVLLPFLMQAHLAQRIFGTVS